jgi:phosphatidate cytidylyltransferase
MSPSAHAKRWITVGFVVPVLVVFFLSAPAGAVAVLAAIVGALALWEYFSLFVGTKSPADLGYLLAVSIGSGIMWAGCAGAFSMMFVLLWVAVFAFSSRAIIRYNQGRPGFDVLVKEAMAILYIPCMLTSIILIRASENGVSWLFLVLFLAFISDTGAFYAGRFFGRHKLIPKISPAKTVEGALGSIVADIIVVIAFKLIVPAMAELSWGFMLAMAVCAAVATQIGDLFESMLKRSYNVKDSGIFFPGHGGMLDRIDGLLFTGPVVLGFMLAAAS